MQRTTHHYPAIWIALLLAVSIAWIFSCSEDKNDPVSPTVTDKSDCRGCHTNQSMLQATALPDSAQGDPSGEG
jgi:hypothetical protein